MIRLFLILLLTISCSKNSTDIEKKDKEAIENLIQQKLPKYTVVLNDYDDWSGIKEIKLRCSKKDFDSLVKKLPNKFIREFPKPPFFENTHYYVVGFNDQSRLEHRGIIIRLDSLELHYYEKYKD